MMYQPLSHSEPFLQKSLEVKHVRTHASLNDCTRRCTQIIFSHTENQRMSPQIGPQFFVQLSLHPAKYLPSRFIAYVSHSLSHRSKVKVTVVGGCPRSRHLVVMVFKRNKPCSFVFESTVRSPGVWYSLPRYGQEQQGVPPATVDAWRCS